MDITRPDVKRRKRRRKLLPVAVVGTLVLLVGALAAFARPTGFSVERDRVYIGTVHRGDMQRDVRGYGNLVPVDIRFLSARSDGTVERIVTFPGTAVQPDTLIMEMSNPELQQNHEQARLALEAAQADFSSFKVRVQSEILQMRSALTQLKAQYEEAQLNARINTELSTDGLVSDSEMKRSDLHMKHLAEQLEIDTQRLKFSEDNMDNQLAVQRSAVEQAQARADLLASQIDALQVRAGVAGVLQKQAVEPGMRVGIGQNLAQVADPANLKAVLRVPEMQAKDVTVGQPATVDTHNGLVKGRVIRIDPNVESGTVAVDIQIVDPLPPGARPDLTVEGTIQLETLKDVLYVERPAYITHGERISVYRFLTAEQAEKTPVTFGRTAARMVEVLDGLADGDRIILSDTTEWQHHDKVRVH